MKKVLIVIYILFCANLVVGQDKKLTADSDTAFWYKYYNTVGNKIKADTAKNNNNEFFFRFWSGYKAIEITKNNSEVKGNIIFFVQQFRKNKEGGRIYSKHVQLTNANAEKVYELILKYKLLELPTDKQVKGWQQGLDGVTYITEFTDKKHYSFKSYWTPTAQKELMEAKQLLGFIEEVEQIKELKDKYALFMQRQPFQRWYGGIGSAVIVSKIITTR